MMHGQDERLPVISVNINVQHFYEELRGNGLDHKFAEVLALRQPPGHAGTERSFFSAHSDPLAGTDVRQRPYLVAELAKNGVSDLSGKRYMPSLAAFVGDPRAVVASRTEVKNVLVERGWGSEGLVKTRVAERRTPLTHELGQYRPSNQLVANELAQRESQNDEMRAVHTAHPEKRTAAFHELSDEMSGLTGRKKPAPPPGMEGIESVSAKAVNQEAFLNG